MWLSLQWCYDGVRTASDGFLLLPQEPFLANTTVTDISCRFDLGTMLHGIIDVLQRCSR